MLCLVASRFEGRFEGGMQVPLGIYRALGGTHHGQENGSNSAARV